MTNWEDILHGFLEGEVMRADVEALRWNIQLSTEARAEVDRELQVVDELAAVGAALAPADEAKAIKGIMAAIDRAGEVDVPSHWVWRNGEPTAGAMQEMEDAEDVELARQLSDLGKSMPAPEGALERLLKKVGEMELPGEMEETSHQEGESMRLFPAGEELKIDALAASEEVKPVEKKTDGEGEKSEDEEDQD